MAVTLSKVKRSVAYTVEYSSEVEGKAVSGIISAGFDKGEDATAIKARLDGTIVKMLKLEYDKLHPPGVDKEAVYPKEFTDKWAADAAQATGLLTVKG